MVHKIAKVAALVFLTVFMLPPAVYAHGQFDLAEMGPPLASSVIVGVASYWLVLLWPSVQRTRERATALRRRRSRAKISLVR